MFGARSALRYVAVAVPLVVDAAGTAAVWAVALGLAGRWAPLVLLLLAAALGTFAFSDSAAQLWARYRFGGRELSAGERSALADAITWLSRAGLGPPLVRLLVVNHLPAGSWARPGGHRIVLVSAALPLAASQGMPAMEVSAVLAQPAVQTVGLRARLSPLGDLLSLPWQFTRAASTGLGRAMARHPLVRLAWSGRWVVAVTAVVQSSHQGHPVIGTSAGGLVALTYALPRARAARARHLKARAVTAVEPAHPEPQLIAATRPVLGLVKRTQN